MLLNILLTLHKFEDDDIAFKLHTQTNTGASVAICMPHKNALSTVRGETTIFTTSSKTTLYEKMI